MTTNVWRVIWHDRSDSIVKGDKFYQAFLTKHSVADAKRILRHDFMYEEELGFTENQCELMGFELVKSYPHDEWQTNRFQKGLIQIEFTYLQETNKLETVDITIDEVIGKEVTLDQLEQLDNILNQ